MTEALKEQIGKLQELQGRIQGLRAVPAHVFQTSRLGGTGKVAEELEVVKGIGEAGVSESVQGALQRARESLDKDGSSLGTEHRQERRKRRGERAATPEGYVNEDRKRTSFVRPATEEGVKMEGLGEWAREFNRTHDKSKLRIRERLLRLTVEDVMTVFLGIGASADGRVRVETIRAFGAREKPQAHGESGYSVFQQLTQQLGKVVEVESGATLQTIVELVESYDVVFVARCVLCGRVVSSEGHVPCVVRRWNGSGWDAEHIGCVIEGPI
ncbi:unnamed protein product [Cyclocybe aegerita]|uniref:Uncharacterized protein n=1 Tax=Cyclocybe aegerita TaxID=1973307 RepID=A0A8S0VQA2_CYCAE|nr:unnamed protein product [Cyclocybe aegerita]